jgi:glucose/arabinose dehydrogenase
MLFHNHPRHDRLRIAIDVLSMLAAALIVLLCISLWSPWSVAYGLDSRAPWTSNHVTGTPEPPPPFEIQRVYPKLTFKTPLEIAFEPGGNRVFIAEQNGKIFSFPNVADPPKADEAINLRDIVKDWKNLPSCQGFDSIYGMAFHPNFAQNHYIFVCYALSFRERPTEPIGTRVVRFTVTGDPPKLDPASAKQIIEWQAGGHNGGCLRFGKEGDLYISAGDQADPNPPDSYNTGQDISDLRASIMRIDIDHADGDKPYSIPADNPFIKTPGARPEVWCYGLRNPWRFSVDRQTGNIWVGDVGWELYESVYCAKSGGNYGWSIMEGPNPVHPEGKSGERKSLV